MSSKDEEMRLFSKAWYDYQLWILYALAMKKLRRFMWEKHNI